MSSHSLSQTPENPQDHNDYYRRVLHDLIDMGADLAQQVHSHANTQPKASQAAADATIAFDRIARTVRRTILLAQQLDARPRSRLDRDLIRTAARRKIIRAVEDAIQRPSEDPAQLKTRETEFRERLDAPELNEDLVDDIAARPITEIIAEICHDLGLGRMPGVRAHKPRKPQDVTTLRTLAAASPPTTCPSPKPPARWQREPA